METFGKNGAVSPVLDQENMTGENHEGKRPNTPVKFLTATSIIGDEVFNNLNENLGKIKDIMVDIHAGKIEYAVIEFGGFLGMGEKYFAVPFGALSIDTKRHGFILGQKREVLEKAPGFDKEHWPETNSHEWRRSSAYWGGFMGQNTGAEPF